MTITALYSLLESAVDSYITGGAEWAIQSGVQKAAQYGALEDFSTDGICIYAWIGAGEAQEESDSPTVHEMEATLYARGKIIGDQALLGLRTAMLQDDLQKMLLSLNGSSACAVSIHSFDEPVISGNTSDVLVRVTCRYIGGAA